MFNINDIVYYKMNKGEKKQKVKIIGVEYDLTNFKYIIEMKDEKVIENVSITKLSYR